MRHAPERRRGVAAAELAILLPFLVLMFVAALDFSRVYRDVQIVQSSAHNAALYASGTAKRRPGVTAEAAARQAALEEGAALSPPLTDDDVRVEFANGTARVTVTYQSHTVTRYPGVKDFMKVRRSVLLPVAPKTLGEE